MTIWPDKRIVGEGGASVNLLKEESKITKKDVEKLAERLGANKPGKIK